MIEQVWEDRFVLFCDECGDECDEVFAYFQDAIAYKKDKDNGWRSITDKYGVWWELCPSCTTPEIIGRLKGIDLPDDSADKNDAIGAIDTALKSLEEL
jgi:hypothetical protein